MTNTSHRAGIFFMLTLDTSCAIIVPNYRGKFKFATEISLQGW